MAQGADALAIATASANLGKRRYLPGAVANGAGFSQVTQWQAQFERLSITQALRLQPGETIQLPESVTADHVRLWGEVRNLLAIAALILKSADFRTESRGGHYRSDYPVPDDHWQTHTVIKDDSIKTSGRSCH